MLFQPRAEVSDLSFLEFAALQMTPEEREWQQKLTIQSLNNAPRQDIPVNMCYPDRWSLRKNGEKGVVMKMRLFVLLLTSLLFIFSLSGCKEAAEEVLFSASEDIVGSWISLSDVDIGGALVLTGARIDIYYNGDAGSYRIEVWYDAVVGEDDPVACSWSGIPDIDPTTSAYCSITVDTTSGPASPDDESVVTMVYNMSGTNSAIFYFDGDAFNVQRLPD